MLTISANKRKIVLLIVLFIAFPYVQSFLERKVINLSKNSKNYCLENFFIKIKKIKSVFKKNLTLKSILTFPQKNFLI